MSSPAGTGARVVLCTCPDEATARDLASGLVGAGLAACVNVLPQVRSVYRWQGRVQEDAEALMVIKTTSQAYPALQAWLLERHPYDVPEILALPVSEGSEPYLAWLTASAN